jgi:hypothetical protein
MDVRHTPSFPGFPKSGHSCKIAVHNRQQGEVSVIAQIEVG